MNDLKEFRPKRGPAPMPTDRAIITIGASGTITLNKVADELLGEPDYVTYLMDADHGRGGIRAAGPNESAVYTVTRHPRSLLVKVYARKFLDALKVDYRSATRRYPVKMVKGVLVFSPVRYASPGNRDKPHEEVNVGKRGTYSKQYAKL